MKSRWFGHIFLMGVLFGSLAGCTWRRTEVMTTESYSSITTGTPIKKVEETYGPPIAIYSCGENMVYEYTERIQMGDSVVQARRYFLTVDQSGRIIKKEMVYRNPAPYNQIFKENYSQTN